MGVPGLVVACATVAALATGAAMAQVPGPSPAPDNRAVRVPPAAGAPLEPCPEDMGGRRGESEPFACTCTAQAADQGTVFGTDVYADASSICRAALHAGSSARAAARSRSSRNRAVRSIRE
jgi:LCCL domain